MAPKSSDDSRKPRASKPKVKTGCTTCKKRHVKCDETKPECLRCSNFGRKCDGYPSEEEEPALKRVPPPATRRLLSKTLKEPPLDPNNVHQQLLPIGLPFHDGQEQYYFHHFRTHTAYELSGGFDPSLWTHLIIQASTNTAIRELTISVGALCLAKSQSKQARRQSQQMYSASSHLQYSLHQYSKGLSRVQAMVSTGQDTIDVALIATLLIFVFESMYGDCDRASTPVQSALDMILRRLSSLERPWNVSRTNPRHERTQAPIDENLLSAFMRLGELAPIVMRTADKMVAYSTPHIFSMAYYTENLVMPSCFATVDEARLFLEDIKWRIVPNHDSYDLFTRNKPQDGYIECPSNQRAFGPGSNLDLNFIRRRIKEWYIPTVTNQPAIVRTQFKEWHSAFAPLLEHALELNTFVPTITLHIQALVDKLFLADELVLPKYREREMKSNEPTYQSILTVIALSRKLVGHPGFSRGFVFDNGILWPLVQILLFCSERKVRKDIYDILRSVVPRREGAWDSEAIANAAERMFEFEDSVVPMEFESRPSHDLDTVGLIFSEMVQNGSSPMASFLNEDMIDSSLRSIPRNGQAWG